MPAQNQAVIGGVDCHTDFHVAVALDPLGRVVGTETFPATGAGYRLTHTWRALFGPIAAVGVESTGSFGAALTRSLVAAAPTTVSRLGCGTHHTAALLVAAGENIDRLGSEASFAHLCATAPVPASSGRTSRHRLNFAGNRAANRALHMIVLVRLRYCERTRSYMDRRLTEGKTKKEAIRCLKRFVARELYRTLRADLATLTTRT